MLELQKNQASPGTTNQDTLWHHALLYSFDAIQLSEMGDVALLCRIDTKYLLSEVQLLQALECLTGTYRILEISGRRSHRYQTLYFDTPDLELYRQHHNGWRDRYKVRERTYLDSGISFWEVKHKIGDHVTLKSRMRTRELSTQIAHEAESFLRTHYPYRVDELEAKLSNTFQRITLVSTNSAERLTVDVGVRLVWNGAQTSLDGIAIAEVKQDGYSTDSAFIRQMRAQGVHPTRLSKYCIGISTLYPQVKYNRFKPQLCQIANLLSRGSTCQTCSSC